MAIRNGDDELVVLLEQVILLIMKKEKPCRGCFGLCVCRPIGMPLQQEQSPAFENFFQGMTKLQILPREYGKYHCFLSYQVQEDTAVCAGSLSSTALFQRTCSRYNKRFRWLVEAKTT